MNNSDNSVQLIFPCKSRKTMHQNGPGKAEEVEIEVEIIRTHMHCRREDQRRVETVISEWLNELDLVEDLQQGGLTTSQTGTLPEAVRLANEIDKSGGESLALTAHMGHEF